MAVKPKLFLHVGPGKTGSSAIQQWLLDRAAALREDGILYPVPEGISQFEGNAAVLVHWLRDVVIQDDEAYRAELRTLLLSYCQEVQDSGCDTLILSEEQLAGAKLRQLVHFKSVAGEIFDLRVIIVARHPYAWLWSSWGQWVKKGGEHRDFAQFARDCSPFYYLSYRDYLDQFDDDLLVLAYSADAMICDFAAAIGVDGERHRVKAAQARRINRSLSRSELQILRRLNRIFERPELSARISGHMIAQRPEAVAHIEMDRDVLAGVEAYCLPTMQRLEQRTPGCVRLPATSPAHDGDGDKLPMSLDLLEQIVLAVEADTLDRARSSVAATQATAAPRRRWPAFIRTPYKWCRRQWAAARTRSQP